MRRANASPLLALLLQNFGIDIGGLVWPYEINVPLATIDGLGAPFFSTEWGLRESIVTGCRLR